MFIIVVPCVPGDYLEPFIAVILLLQETPDSIACMPCVPNAVGKEVCNDKSETENAEKKCGCAHAV